MIPGDDPLSGFVMLLGRLERLNDELVTEVCGRHGISPSEIRVLAMLRETGPEGVRPASISRWVLQTAGGLSATLRRLEADDRIVRTDDPDDARGKRISLTESGERFHDEVLGEITDRYRFALGDLDLDAAREQVGKLIGAFERFGNHPSSSGWDSSRLATTTNSTAKTTKK